MVRVRIKWITVGWLLLVAALALLGDISVAATGTGSTAANFLNIGPGARAAGMGGAFTAVSEGALATYWNPAGLSAAEGGEIALGHFSWYGSSSLQNASAAFKLDDKTSIGASITYLSYGQIEGYNEAGQATGDLTAYDMAVGISIGRQITDQLSAGITGKLISQKAEQAEASAVAVDLGLRYSTERYSIAGVASNLGSKMKYGSIAEDLPVSYRIGLAARLINRTVLATVDYDHRPLSNAVFRNGLELKVAGQYFLRAGYNHVTKQGSQSNSGPTFGAGLRFNRLGFDYAWSSSSQFGSEALHRFSLAIQLGSN